MSPTSPEHILADLRTKRDEGWLGVQRDSDSDGWLRWNAYGPAQEYVDFGRGGLDEWGVHDQAYCPVYPTAVAAWISHVKWYFLDVDYPEDLIRTIAETLADRPI
jgi:hypothetical protein